MCSNSNNVFKHVCSYVCGPAYGCLCKLGNSNETNSEYFIVIKVFSFAVKRYSIIGSGFVLDVNEYIRL